MAACLGGVVLVIMGARPSKGASRITLWIWKQRYCKERIRTKCSPIKSYPKRAKLFGTIPIDHVTANESGLIEYPRKRRHHQHYPRLWCHYARRLQLTRHLQQHWHSSAIAVQDHHLIGRSNPSFDPILRACSNGAAAKSSLTQCQRRRRLCRFYVFLF